MYIHIYTFIHLFLLAKPVKMLNEALRGKDTKSSNLKGYVQATFYIL